MARSLVLGGLILPLLLAGGAASAADSTETDQLREQLRATVLQLRQLQDQQAVVQPAAPAVDPALRARLAAAQAQLRAARAGAAKAALLQADLDKAHADNDALIKAKASDDAELDKYKTAYTQATDQGRALGVERDGLKARLAKMTSVATACQAKNDRLTSWGRSLMSAYRRLTVGQLLAAREPFLGLERVKLENIEQEQEDGLRGQPLRPSARHGARREAGGRIGSKPRERGDRRCGDTSPIERF